MMRLWESDSGVVLVAGRWRRSQCSVVFLILDLLFGLGKEEGKDFLSLRQRGGRRGEERIG